MKENIDILMVQPPVMKKQTDEHPVIAEYYAAVDKLGVLIGDSPYEINQGLKRIAEYVLHKNPGIKIKMLDLNFIDRDKRAATGEFLTESDVVEILWKYDAKLTLFSFMTQSYAEWSYDLITAARKMSGHILLGGIHPTVFSKEIMHDAQSVYIDGIVIGEGEKVISELAKNMDDLGNAIKEHPLIYYAHAGGRGYTGFEKQKIRATTTREEFAEEIPPRHDLFSDYSDKITHRINTAWGCSNQCSFCSVGSFFNKCGSRRKTLNQVMNEITSLDKNQFIFGDLCMFDDMSLSDKLLDSMIATKVPYEWWCQTRADKITAALCEKMKRAGCKQVAIGCESGSDEQLKKISKGVDVETIRKSLETIRNAGMETQCYWIIGLPGETAQTARMTQDKIIEYLEQGLCTVPHISVLVPYPGTPLFENSLRNPAKSGINIHTTEFDEYWMNCDMHGCGVPVYDTVDRDGKTLLTSERIYSLWLETLSRVTQFANKNR